MDELSGFASTPRTSDPTVRIWWVAERQWGVISRQQMLECGVGEGSIARWSARTRLHRILPGVYALGHRSVSAEGRLLAALLYAGSDAALSHATAMWWWGLIPDEPTAIDVSAAGHRGSLPTLRVHHPRRLATSHHRRFPITTVAQSLLDFASSAPLSRVRRALAEADYRRLLDLSEVEQALGRGRPGSATLRKALKAHRPELALTRSVLEERFLALCESAKLSIPEVNAKVQGLMVDFFWPEQRLIVELDGQKAHSTPFQRQRDHGRDLTLRAAGNTVRRYTWAQLTAQAAAVEDDLRRALSPPALSA